MISNIMISFFQSSPTQNNKQTGEIVKMLKLLMILVSLQGIGGSYIDTTLRFQPSKLQDLVEHDLVICKDSNDCLVEPEGTTEGNLKSNVNLNTN